MIRTFTGIVSLILVLSSFKSQAANYYWVGGTGLWTDLTHWATTSGGSTKHTAVPTSADDVFFDALSFSTTGQIVTVTDGATCKTMDWSAATNSPTIKDDFFPIVNIYGGLIIPATVQRNFLGSFHLKATSGPFNVNLGNLPLSSSNNETIYFEGTGGTWTLTGGINLNAISLTAGTLNTNGQPITCSVFGTTGSTAQAINLGASAISVGTWNITSTNITINAGTSSITSTFSFNGKNLTYNNLIISGTSSVLGSNTFNTITLNADAILKLKEGTTQTISNLVSNGTSVSPVTIKSVTDGSTATLSKASGTISVSYARIQDNIATGGATFTAPTGSVDLGNVTGWNITVSEPTMQVSGLTFSKVLPTSVELRWTIGNGAKRIIVAKAGSAVSTAPSDLTSYTAAAFGTGTQTGTGNYVVYTGNADRATITGLTAGTVYHFAVYEFSGSGTLSNFLTTAPATINTTTLATTAVIISSSPVSVCSGQYFDTGGDDNYNYNNSESFTQTLTPNIAGNVLKLDFNAYSFYLGSGDVLNIYDGANTSAALIGSYTGGSLPGTAGIVTATNAAGQLTIQFTSDAFTTGIGWGANISCVVPPLATQPTVAASALVFSNVASTSMTLSWANGNGNNRIVVARVGTAVTTNPTDAVDYAANAAYGSGASLGSNQYVVYNGTGSTVNVTNLAANNTYYFSVIEYNKSTGTTPNYLTPVAAGATGNKITLAFAAEPTIQSTAVVTSSIADLTANVGWTSGNGVRRVVVVKQGSAVNAVPVDGTLYPTPSDFSTATDLGGGNKVMYAGSSNSIYISGLSAQTTYYIAVFEYNGTTAGTTNYLSTTPATGSFTTLATAPTANPNLYTSTTLVSALFRSVNLQWASTGGAEKYLVVFQKGTFSNTINDGLEYTASPVFGQGASVGTNAFIVYAGTGNSVNVTGLDEGTQYFFSILGYKGSGITTNYLTSGSSRGIATLKGKPTTQPTNLAITNVATDSLRITWQGGDGDNSLVVVRAGEPVSFSIKDSTEVDVYTNYFGEGFDFGNGNTAVYRGSNNTVSIKKLAPGTTYYVAVYEYNRTTITINGTSKTYNYFQTANPATGNATTISGKNFYWVGGTGKWSDYQHHWATASGGTAFHSAIPSASDNVYFDAASFVSDKDSVIMDQNGFMFRDMDWTAITKKAAFASPKGISSCSRYAEAYGSFKLSDLMTIDLYSITFKSTYKGNVINLANKKSTSSCLGSITFWGYGGEWTLTSNGINLYNLNMYAGSLIATNTIFNMSGGLSFGNLTPKRIEFGNSTVNLYSIAGATDTNNTWINGGKFIFTGTNSQVAIEAGGSHFKKVTIKGSIYNTVKVSGTIAVDSLQIDPGREIQFEAGKTYTIDKMIVNGDSSKTTFIHSTKPGVAASFVKSAGSIDLKYVLLKDNNASGGAQFNALNSVNVDNVSGWNITNPDVFIPKKSASVVLFKKALRTDLKMKWTSGDGMKRIVVAKESTPVDVFPADNKTYSANIAFGSGFDLGNGNFVVYDGIRDTTDVTGLTAGKTYHFAVLEYNTWNDKIKYKRTLPATGKITMVGTSDIVFSNAPATAGNVKFFDDGGNGFYTRNKNVTQTISPATAGTKLGVLFTYFEMPAFDSLIVYDGASTSAPAIGKFKSTSSKPTSALIATNASGVLTFQLKGNNSSETDDAFKGWVAELFSVGIASSEPTIQSSALTISSKTDNSFTLKTTKGNGAARMIIAKETNAVSKFPVDGITLTANPVFGEGAHLGDGNYLVYSGQDETVTVTGLKGNTAYHFASVEFNGSAGTTNYLLTNPATTKDTTLVAKPTIASSAISFSNITKSSINVSYISGNGTNKIVVVRKSKEVQFTPVDGTVYGASQSFGASASQGDSTYIVSNSDYGYGLFVFNLEQGTTYYFKIFEYNGSGKKIKYLASASLSGKVNTLGPVITMKKINSTYCPNAAVEVPFTVSSAFNSGSKLKLQLSDTQGSFASSVTLKDTLITELSGLIKAKLPNTVNGGAGYKLRIVSSSPVIVSDSIRTIAIPDVPNVSITQNAGTFTSSVATGVQWYRGGIPITGATSSTLNSVEDGVYSVKVSVGNCFKTSNSIVIMGLEEITENNVMVYPNPVQHELTIERAKESSPAKFLILDTQGRELINGSLNEERTNVDVKNFPQGIFFIKVVSEKSASITKFVHK